MDKYYFFNNLVKAKYHLAGVFGAIAFFSYNSNLFLKDHIFGHDGNGGDMLKIYTYLTDQEMSHLRFQKRLSYHNFKMEKDQFKNVSQSVNDIELKEMGIKFPEDKYVEYNKRPPHDFYI